MTVVAIVAAGDVCRVFAGCDDAIVTGAAGTQNLCVVYRVSGHPGVRVMAVFANIRRLNVSGIFAGGFRTVVAAKAVAGNANVIEIRR